MRLQLNLANPEHAGRVFDAADLTLCVGEPPVSSRVAHHLGFVSGGLYAAEAYLAARGEPAHPSDLRESKIASASGCAPMAWRRAGRWPAATASASRCPRAVSRSMKPAWRGGSRRWRRRGRAGRRPGTLCARACCAGSCRNGAWRRCPSMRDRDPSAARAGAGAGRASGAAPGLRLAWRYIPMPRAISTAHGGSRMNRCDSIMTQRRARRISGSEGTKPGCWRACFCQRRKLSVAGSNRARSR